MLSYFFASVLAKVGCRLAEGRALRWIRLRAAPDIIKRGASYHLAVICKQSAQQMGLAVRKYGFYYRLHYFFCLKERSVMRSLGAGKKNKFW